jgi:predicted O-methyltransferase YrrM
MLKRLAWRAFQLTRLDAVLLAECVPALHHDGWLRSFREKRSVDLEGRPLPWMTYSAIEFLSRRVRPEMTVFEYGCGASTLWWASRVRTVTSVEHDAGWARRMSEEAPPNVTIVHEPVEATGRYARNALAHGRRFDVVVIDGQDRVRCVAPAIEALAHDGVIVFDNSDRTEYEEGYHLLRAADFRKIEFVGMGPVVDYKFETSVHYRVQNALGI